jgi:hypothetical protein
VNLQAQQDEKAPIPDDLPTPANNETRFALAVTNETSIVNGERVPLPQVSNIGLLQTSFSYKHGERWRFSTSLTGEFVSSPEANSRLQVREAYAGLSTGDFDWTLGKRILKWGTGYAFTPTGVLDPSRIPTDPTDPTDHLSLNQGRELGSLSWTNGPSSATAVWSSAGLLGKRVPGVYDTVALRYNVLYKGVDSAVIFAHDSHRQDLWGANFTRVFGDGLEFHGEFARRSTSAGLFGINYTHSSGWGAIAEYYTAGASPDWIPIGQNPSLAPTSRRHYYYARILRAHREIAFTRAARLEGMGRIRLHRRHLQRRKLGGCCRSGSPDRPLLLGLRARSAAQRLATLIVWRNSVRCADFVRTQVPAVNSREVLPVKQLAFWIASPAVAFSSAVTVLRAPTPKIARCGLVGSGSSSANRRSIR